MNPGSLNSRVTIKQRAAGQDEVGQPLETLEDVATVWANIRNRSGTEAIRSDKDTSIVQASIRIRIRRDLNAGMEVHHGATVYMIKAVLPDEINLDRMDLACEVVHG